MHPEHFDLSSPVFLPITDEVCASLLGADGAKLLATLTDAELAAVLVIQNLAGASAEKLTSHEVERVLMSLIAWSVDNQHSASSGLLSEAKRLFDPRKLYAGRNFLKSLKVRYLAADEVLARDYLLPSGKWDAGFKVRHLRGKNPFSQQMVTPRHRELWLSPAQDKLIRTFHANMDEDLHVQGYAGIGKSHLLGALTEYLKPEETLLLAHTPGKLDALRKRMGSAGDRKIGATFIKFAQFLLYGPRHQPVTAALRVPSKQDLAEELNILCVRHYDAQATLNICLKVIECYCRSGDKMLSAKHLPHFNYPLSHLDTTVLLQNSSRLWSYLESNPSWGRNTGFEGLLLIKRADLAARVVPARYTHVLIDESQDVPMSLLKIIERGRQVLITLGDEYQQAKGSVVRRSREVRRSDISHSVRCGRNVESLINPLIFRHSAKGKIAFEGASSTDVSIEHYPVDFLPPEGCVVMAASYWDMMKWAIQLSENNCRLHFATQAAEADFKYFMATAVALFKPDYYSADQGADGPHPHFSEMISWQQVREVNKFDESFSWVDEKLEKGFNFSDVVRVSMMFEQSGSSCILMMAEEAGGMEFDKVLLTPELLTTVMFKNASEFDKRICEIYIAISRARRELYIPYDVVEWIEYHHNQLFREDVGY